MTGKRKTQRGDARGGTFLLLPHCLLNSEAFRTASPRAIKVLLALCAKHNGFNNGAIGLGFRDLGEWGDCQNHAANNRALGELIARGLIALECEHPRACRHSSEYRLTFMPTEHGPATNDYLTWKLGDAGTCTKRSIGNFGVAVIATKSASRVATTATGEETSRCEDRNGVHAKQPFLQAPPVAKTATHIINHVKASSEASRATQQSLENGVGRHSVAPDAKELRERVLMVLGGAPRGSQGQLAALAQILPAALSKFLNNDGPLNDHARIRLTLALPKVAVEETL